MAANDNAISCGSNLTLLELFAAAIGKDATGKATLRLYDSNSVAGSKFFSCGFPTDITNVEATVANLFTLDANGDIAIRVSLL